MVFFNDKRAILFHFYEQGFLSSSILRIGSNCYKHCCTIIYMRYRSRDEIIGSILQSAATSKGITKTKIMFSSFLSYQQLLYYLDFLVGEGLLEYDSHNRVYRTEQKGLDFLELNKQITKLIKIPG